MRDKVRSAVEEVLGSSETNLTRFERHVLQSILKKNTISRDTQREYYDTRTLGQKLADQVALIGGSWTFIIISIGIFIGWMLLNSLILSRSDEAFDPYPYILLNLVLSMTVAIQAPIIMMSQNRQAAQDRLQATNDYEVNLKAELEIERLHEKLDELRQGEWKGLLEVQERQLQLLKRLMNESDKKAAARN